MHTRQFCTPHLVDENSAIPLERVVFDDRSIKEGWFQNLLYNNPSLIPIDEIEKIFGPLIPVARELQSGVGPVDVVYISPDGYITLVETKLFRTPESRRKVVAQILDYASAMSGWTYQEFCEAVRLNRGEELRPENDTDPIVQLVRDHPDFDEARFIDSVTKNLSEGRFLLLVVGDGIQHGVEHLAATLAATPHLHFSLALLELALFRTGTPVNTLFAQPRVMARTKEVTRAVIELRDPLRTRDVKVTMPEAVHGAGAGERRRLTEEAMFETMAAALGAHVVDQFRVFLRDCEKLAINTETKGTSLSLVWYEPNTEQRFSFASIFAEGGFVNLKFVLHNYRKCGIDPQPGLEYVNAVAALVPGSTIREYLKDGKAWPRVFVGSREITLADLMPKSAEWLVLLASVTTKTEQRGLEIHAE